MITRRGVLLAGTVGLLFAHARSIGQPAATARRVGWLSLGSEARVAHLYAAFKQGMEDLGWRDGKDLEYRFVYADGVVDRLDGLAAELIGQNVDVIIVGNPTSTRADARAVLVAAQRACSALGLVAQRIVASARAQFGAAVEQVVRQRAQAVVVVADPVYPSERDKLQPLLQATRLPVAYGWREHVVEGGLLSYSADLAASFRYAAKYVDKILRGAKPADLPVEQANKFELVINQKTAKAIGIAFPQAVLVRADEVIQ